MEQHLWQLSTLVWRGVAGGQSAVDLRIYVDARPYLVTCCSLSPIFAWRQNWKKNIAPVVIVSCVYMWFVCTHTSIAAFFSFLSPLSPVPAHSVEVKCSSTEGQSPLRLMSYFFTISLHEMYRTSFCFRYSKQSKAPAILTANCNRLDDDLSDYVKFYS